LIAWIRDAGAVGIGVFALTYVLATVLALPGAILTLGAGFAYGPILGTMLVSPVSVLAATVSFLLGRTAAREWIARRIGHDPRFAAVDAAIGREGFKIVLLLRLSPVFPFSVLNYALGITRVRLRDYILASFIGMLPATVMYVYLGSLVTTAASLGAEAPPDHASRQILYWAGLGATVLATVFITRLARKALRAELAAGDTRDSAS
jgi:uncharacterized membrane protein YdjX (TVP38/TMEM64 family)